MTLYSGDPITDFLRHDAQQEAWLRHRPKCCLCGEHIQDEPAYRFSGKKETWICEECMCVHLEYVEEYI